MEHIKTPVRVTLHGNIADSANELAFEARGPNFANLSKEAVHAINAYDDLIAQRDALVAACEAFIDVLDKSPGDLELLQFVARLASVEEKARTALALVKESQ